MNVKRAFALLALFVVGINVAAAQDISVYADHLDGPRGLKFGPDGALYVAEAGQGGSELACINVPFVGPYHGGPTARISKNYGTQSAEHCRRRAAFGKKQLAIRRHNGRR